MRALPGSDSEPRSVKSGPSLASRDNAGISVGIALDELAAQSEVYIRARQLPPAVTLALLFAQFVNRKKPDEVEA